MYVFWEINFRFFLWLLLCCVCVPIHFIIPSRSKSPKFWEFFSWIQTAAPGFSHSVWILWVCRAQLLALRWQWCCRLLCRVPPDWWSRKSIIKGPIYVMKTIDIVFDFMKIDMMHIRVCIYKYIYTIFYHNMHIHKDSDIYTYINE